MPLSNIKQAFGAATNFTKTNANLTVSATAGWKSNAIDNSANLYLDALVNIELALVNTAPAGGQVLMMYAYSYDGTSYSGTGAAAIDGTEGTVTFPNYTNLPVNLPVLGIVPYSTQNVAIVSPLFSVAACFGGILPQKWGIAMINDTGMTLNVTNLIYIEVYRTVG